MILNQCVTILNPQGGTAARPEPALPLAPPTQALAWAAWSNHQWPSPKLRASDLFSACPSHLPSRPSCEVWGPYTDSSALHLAQPSCLPFSSLSASCTCPRFAPDAQLHTLLTHTPPTSHLTLLLTPQCGPGSPGPCLSRRREWTHDRSHRPWERCGGREPRSLAGASPKAAEHLRGGARPGLWTPWRLQPVPLLMRDRTCHTLDSGLLGEWVIWQKPKPVWCIYYAFQCTASGGGDLAELAFPSSPTPSTSPQRVADGLQRFLSPCNSQLEALGPWAWRADRGLSRRALVRAPEASQLDRSASTSF